MKKPRTGEGRNRQVSWRVPTEIYNQLDQQAAMSGLGVNAVVNQILDDYLGGDFTKDAVLRRGADSWAKWFVTKLDDAGRDLVLDVGDLAAGRKLSRRKTASRRKRRKDRA